MVLMGFCVFEICCGVYFPSIGTMRGKFIPEEVRSTIMNIFRIGLNLIVVLVLWNVRAANEHHTATFAAALFPVAAVVAACFGCGVCA